MDRDAVCVLLEPLASPPQLDSIRAQPLAAGLEQQQLQVSAMDRELRRGIAGVAAERFPVDELAEAVVEHRLPGLDRNARQRALQPELAQFPARVRQDIDACAERRNLGGRFEHSRRDARAMQGERQRESADARADDDHFHEAKLLAMRIPVRCVRTRAGPVTATRCSPFSSTTCRAVHPSCQRAACIIGLQHPRPWASAAMPGDDCRATTRMPRPCP